MPLTLQVGSWLAITNLKQVAQYFLPPNRNIHEYNQKDIVFACISNPVMWDIKKLAQVPVRGGLVV